MVTLTSYLQSTVLLAFSFSPTAAFNVPYQQSQVAPQSDSFVISNILQNPGAHGIDFTPHEYSPWQSSGTPAPLYITIGPPASGKTTWLSKQMVEQNPQSQGEAVDISMDDQLNVYVKVPFQLYCMSQAEMEGPDVLYDNQYVLDQKFYQRTIRERILSEDQYELRLVCQRLSGKISRQEFKNSMRSYHSESYNHDKVENAKIDYVVKVLIERIENLMGNQAALPVLPSTVDLFVIEAVFDRDPSRPQCEWTGVERTNNLLHQTPTNVPIAWGNTNTFAGDYVVALDAAAQQGRPVYFCVYGDNNSLKGSEQYFDLPRLNFEQLIDRNLQRFLQSGKYIPSMILEGHATATDKIVAEAARTMTTGTKLDFDRQFAKMAGFEMQDDRTVARRGQGGNSNNWERNRELPQEPYDDPLYWPGNVDPPPVFHHFNPFDHHNYLHRPPPPPPFFPDAPIHEDFPWNEHPFPRPNAFQMESNDLPPEFGYPAPSFRPPEAIKLGPGSNRFARRTGDNSDNPLNYQGGASSKKKKVPFESSVWGAARSRETYQKRSHEENGKHGYAP